MMGDNWWDYADPEEDFVTEEELDEVWRMQYIPTERKLGISDEARKALSTAREPSDIAKGVATYALQFIDKETFYHTGGGRTLTNPLEEEEPYGLDSASFVYWCFHKAGARLKENEGHHTILTIKNDPKLYNVGNIGSYLDPNDLTIGDIVFFKGDRHIGIYTGEGRFVSCIGSGYNNYSGGVRELPMNEGKWRAIFQGHVMRLKEGIVVE